MTGPQDYVSTRLKTALRRPLRAAYVALGRGRRIYRAARRRLPGARAPLAISMPIAPLRLVGSPARPRNDAWRIYRRAYDWAVYDERQLRVMESYWDECVGRYASLLPRRLLDRPAARFGVNLGTFNGAFQKAWMRLGFRMYGIEHNDVLQELHAYGCDGELGNFFALTSLPDARFDFAVIDRALFNKPDQAFVRTAGGRYEERRASQPASCQVWGGDGRPGGVAPPYFAEALRVLKPDGVLLAVLYRHWSEEALRELYAAGEVTLTRFRNRPHLGVVVDRARPPKPFPDLNELVRGLSGGSAQDAVRRARASRLVGKALAWRDGTAMIHFLPTNHTVVFDPRHAAIRRDESVLNDAEAAAFFMDATDALREVAPGAARSPAAPLILLCDPGVIRDAGAGVYCHPNMTRGSHSLAAVLPFVAEELAQNPSLASAWVVIGVAERDAIVKARSGGTAVPVATARRILGQAIARLKPVASRISLLLPGAVELAPGDPRLARQRAAIDEYRAMISELAAERAVDTLDWSREAGSLPAALAQPRPSLS